MRERVGGPEGQSRGGERDSVASPGSEGTAGREATRGKALRVNLVYANSGPKAQRQALIKPSDVSEELVIFLEVPYFTCERNDVK